MRLPQPGVILASASPRRRELLASVIPDFEVRPSAVDEKEFLVQPLEKGVQAAAREKALQVSRIVPSALVIGADTVVVVDGMALGKPARQEDAVKMLRQLSGREHCVLTGIAVAVGEEYRTAYECTQVKFAPLSVEQIDSYVGTGEPMDKAGAYGIQGRASIFIEGISGCYFNVVGLPVFRLSQMLAEFGIRPWEYWSRQNPR